MAFRFADVEAIFRQALELPVGDRAAFLNSACPGNEALQREVQALLHYHDQPIGVLENPLEGLRQQALESLRIETGQRIGTYSVLGLLGTGGMGRVYLAHDSRLDRKVALKFLKGQEDSAARMEREVRAISALNHPNILTIHELGVWENRPVLVSEYVEGHTLRQVLQRGPLPRNLTLNIAIQTASALEAAHKSGFVHRDIKPENIMIRQDGLVKVLDFGLAKRVSAAPSGHQAFETKTGHIIGTAAYMSPEQLTGGALDGRTDLWSLGVVIWEMATGQSPFLRASTAETIAAILATEATPPRAEPDALHTAVELCTRRNAAERYKTAGDLIEHLQSIRSDVVRTRSRRQPARPLPVRLLAAAITTVLFGGGWWAWSRRPAPHFPVEPVNRLTVQGRPADVAISPDGRYIAYVSVESNESSLWMRQTAPESDVRIVPRRNVQYRGLAFNRDGSFLYYTVDEPEGRIRVLHKIAVIGGQSRMILRDIDTAPSFSPDGSRFAFVRGKADGTSSLVVAGEDGVERVLATRRPPLRYETVGAGWSPDGKRIAVIGGEQGKGRTLLTVRVADGAEAPVGRLSWEFASKPTWISGGHRLLMLAIGNSRQILRIVEVSYPDGSVDELFPGDLNFYRGLSVASNPPSLVTLRAEEMMSIWDASDTAQPRPMTLNSGRYNGVAFLSGGVVTQSDLAGRWDLWHITADGEARVRLTNDDATESDPAVCRGETVVFRSNRSGRWNLWRVGADGGNLKPLTTGAGPDGRPTCAPDDPWVYYTSFQSGVETIWRVALTGGQQAQVTHVVSMRAAISPDGRRLVAVVLDSATEREGRVAILSATDGRVISRMRGFPADPNLGWHPNGNEIVYVETRNGISNLVARSVGDGSFRQITQFNTEQISSYAWSADGKRLVCVRGIRQHDLIHVGALKALR